MIFLPGYLKQIYLDKRRARDDLPDCWVIQVPKRTGRDLYWCEGFELKSCDVFSMIDLHNPLGFDADVTHWMQTQGEVHTVGSVKDHCSYCKTEKNGGQFDCRHCGRTVA